jgi:uncharacterized membrane protein
MSRPIISIPRTQSEIIHTIVSIASLLFTIIYLAMKWADLPNPIPIHFNPSGEADGWGSRFVLIILPLLSLAMFIGLSILAKFPQKFNYLVQITTENAKNQYSNGRLLLSWINLEIVLLFSYIEWRVIRISLESSSGLGVFFYVLLISILVTIVYHLVRMRK